MQKLTTERELWKWACDLYVDLEDPAQSILYLLGDHVLPAREYTLVMLRASDADALMEAHPVNGGVRVTSTPELETKYGVSIDVKLPRAAFSRFSNAGMRILRFMPQDYDCSMAWKAFEADVAVDPSDHASEELED
jgi:hypothetical protein